MKPLMAVLAALTLALAPEAGFAYAPEVSVDVGSSAYAPISSGSHEHIGVQIQQQDDDGPDILLMALLTVGAAGAAAIVSLIGYVIRQRVGFWLHRPPPRDAGHPEDHH